MLFFSPTPTDAYRFANWDIIPSIGIMAFGKNLLNVYKFISLKRKGLV